MPSGLLLDPESEQLYRNNLRTLQNTLLFTLGTRTTIRALQPPQALTSAPAAPLAGNQSGAGGLDPPPPPRPSTLILRGAERARVRLALRPSPRRALPS